MLLLTLAIGFVMAMIDVTAVNTALSAIAIDLEVPLSGLVWVVDGYTLTFAALLLAGGALADRYGARRAYQGGLAVFVLGSVLCALAPGGGALVAARLLQGCGAALFMPSSLALLMHAVDDERQRARMFGLWSALVSAAATVGPLAGGLLVETFGWRSIFWLNLPLGVAGIVLTGWRAPAPPSHPRSLGLISHGLGAGALASLAFVLIDGPELGWTAPPVLAALATAMLLGVLLVRRERRAAQPVLPRALYGSAPFRAALVTGLMINVATFGQLFVVSLLMQQGHGIGALGTGLAILPMTAAAGIMNVLSGRAIAAYGTRMPLLAGLGGGAAAALLLTGAAAQTPPWLVVMGGTLLFVALGFAIPAMTATVMGAGGKALANSAGAALNANRQVGALLGVALAGTILHAVPDWGLRLALVYGAIAAGLACAWLAVWHGVRQPAAAPAALLADQVMEG
ncbi:DHA2 family methylenomycin A resistance protein-like MFS transporter [Pseudoduganella lurida]|uniref:DHA2 family methylenomycin A resistance protein-like MFS transporter n=1 Tax=Pseudoduganella lurida TaxID=1036180 RepID=A0A562RC36_9BURK|nr:MFS transporter [Pseudoduganella lurida]TWI66611.1 DHA2 family methylenomycin A resistance protein-like MFS transporter [Pseudoduganella lurida]